MDEGNRFFEEELARLSPDLSSAALKTLAHMYSSKTLDGTEKKGVAVGETFISSLQGSELNRVFRQADARSTLEIGFAFGFSTIWIIDAIGADGHHIAVDPYELSAYGGVGLKQVQDTENFAMRFEWQADLSIHQVTKYIKEGKYFDAIFIDGNHRFDDVIVDFYLCDYVLKIGGIIAFDDVSMKAIEIATSFIRSNRQYELVPNKEPNMLVMRKLDRDTRRWDHFVPFDMVTADEGRAPKKRSFFRF